MVYINRVLLASGRQQLQGKPGTGFMYSRLRQAGLLRHDFVFFPVTCPRHASSPRILKPKTGGPES